MAQGSFYAILYPLVVGLILRFLLNYHHEEKIDFKVPTEFERIRDSPLRALSLAILAVGARSTDASIRSVVMRWIDARLDIPSEDPAPLARADLEAAMEKAIAQVRGGAKDLEPPIRFVRAAGDERARRMAMGLALDLLVDRAAEADDIEALRHVAARVGLPPQDYREMVGERFGRAHTTAAERNALLGLDPEWDDEWTRDKLTALYLWWRTVADEAVDPERLAEAERIIDSIYDALDALNERARA
jgi:hypothetical protein